MKKAHIIFFIIISTCFSTTILAQTFVHNVEQATETARVENKNVLLVFTGSDWCKPCILLKRDVLGAPEFKEYAEENLVLCNLDFPFQKKNKPSKEIQAYNDEKAAKYNPEGHFPRVILLDQEANTIKEFDYKPGMAPSNFIQQIQTSI